MFYQYTIIQWLFFFYFYCFFGWCFESGYVSLKKHRFVNRGFMKGPFLPLYGSGAIVLLVVSKPFTDCWWAVFIAGCIGATVLELVTGIVMEKLFKIKYWDYSKHRVNFKGYICLESTLAWGGLTLLMTYVVHQPIADIILSIREKYLTLITILLTFFIAGDFTLSFRAALDLRDILVRMEKAKAELQRVQKRLEVIVAVAGETISENIDQYKESLTAKLRIEELRENLENKHKNLIRKVKNNPTMSSVKYKDALEELKNWVSSKKEK